MYTPCTSDISGTGNTLVSEELSGDILDFTHQFVGRAFSKVVTIHNMGRKAVTLTLVNEKIEEIKKALSKGKHFCAFGSHFFQLSYLDSSCLL